MAASKFIALRRLNAGRLMIWNQRLALRMHHNDNENDEGVEAKGRDVETLGSHSLKENDEDEKKGDGGDEENEILRHGWFAHLLRIACQPS